ncbi:Mu-type HTH domain [Bartonella choladocola]|uniref:Mu transposase C-terminal domain-containing protein n=1 Tax=Bartonella choladocola TaxID=2750995 RepID=UPI0039993946
MFQSFYSPQEIADAIVRHGLKVMPGTKRGVQIAINREGWDNSPLARKRCGRSGGMEYHISLLPMALQTALMVEYTMPFRRNEVAKQKSRDLVKADQVQMTDLTARQKDVMNARAGVLHHISMRMFDKGDSQRSAILAFLADLQAGRLAPELAALAIHANDKGRGLSRGTIARWFAMREDGGLIALAPKKTREKQSAPVWLKAFLKYYRQPQKPSVAQSYERWCLDNQGQTMPSLRQVRHALDKLPEIEKQRGRMGPHELKTLKAYKSRDVSDLLAASVYVADGKTFDAEIAHPLHGQAFKPEITTIIDAHSRKIVGWSAALDENANAVIDALLMAARTCAIPALFYSDNGRGYKNKKMEDDLTGFLSRLGTTPTHAIAYNSQAKGVIENFNKRWTVLAREFPTYIGRDMDREASTLVHKTTRKDIQTSGISSLLPSWSEFLEACQNLIDRYNDRPHRGLDKMIDPVSGKRRHMTPNEVWARSVANGFTPDLIDDEEARDLLQPWVIRKTRRALVEWLGNSYFAIELEKYHGKEVIVAYDIHDAQKVVVREIVLADGERKPGKLIAVAQFEGHKTRFVPYSAEQAAMEKRHKGRKARAMRKVDAIDAELHAITLDAYSDPVMPMQPIEAPRPVLVASNDAPIVQQNNSTTASKRPNFRDDAEYARWLLDNPEKVTPQDQSNIRDDLLATKHNADFLGRQGVDLDALVKLARSAA